MIQSSGLFREQAEKPKLTAYIENIQHNVPVVALNEVSRELVHLGKVTAEMVKDSCEALVDRDMGLAQRVMVQEDQFVDPVTKEITQFVNKLIQEDLSIAQQKRCFQLKIFLTDVERVGDMAQVIAQAVQERLDNEVMFSARASDQLQNLADNVFNTYTLALKAFEESNTLIRQPALPYNSLIDLS